MSGRDAGPAAPPRAVIEWMERFGGGRGPRDAGSDGDAALRALREALARPGRNREGAFALLAADGLLTRAIEAAAESADPESELRRLLEAVGGAASEAEG